MDEKPLHPSYLRLLEVAKLCRIDEGDIPSEISMSATRVGMWRHRGVSREGAILAATAFNTSPNYILDGSTHAPQLPDHHMAALAEALSYIKDKQIRYQAWHAALNAIAAFSPALNVPQDEKQIPADPPGKLHAPRRS